MPQGRPRRNSYRPPRRLRPSRSRAATAKSARPFSGPRLGGSSSRPCAAGGRGRFLPASACNRVRPACANRRLGISPPRLFAFSSSLRSCRPSLSPRRTASPFAIPGRSCRVRPSLLGASPRRKLRPAVRRKDGLAETFIAPPRRLTLRDPGPQLSGTPVPSRCLASERTPPGRAPQGDAAVSFRHPLATAFGRPVRIGGSAFRLPASPPLRVFVVAPVLSAVRRGESDGRRHSSRAGLSPPRCRIANTSGPTGVNFAHRHSLRCPGGFRTGHGLRSGGCNDCVAVSSPRLVRLRRHSQSVASLSSAVRIIRFTKGL